MNTTKELENAKSARTTLERLDLDERLNDFENLIPPKRIPPPPPADSDSTTERKNSIKEGFLMKKGQRRRNWKQRWFVLNENSFSYYSSPTKDQLKGSIDMKTKDVIIEEAKELKFKSKERKFCFKISIKSQNKEYIIDANTEAEMYGWIRVLNKVLGNSK